MPLPANPLENPSALDVLVVTGVASPGIVSLQGGERPYNWDVRYALGLQGAVIMYWGWKLSENIKFTFKFWEAAQITEFYTSFLPLLQYDVTKRRPKPVTVYHPILQANDITSVVTKEIGPLVDLGNQLWSVTVTFLEYRLPKRQKAAVTPDSAQEKRPIVLDRQDHEILSLTAMAGLPVPSLLP